MTTFKLTNHGLQVTFTKEAERWCLRHHGTLFETAEEAALKHKAKQPIFHAGIRVEEIKPGYMAENDNPNTRWPLRKGDPGYDALKKLEAEEVATKKTDKLPERAADTGDPFEPVEVRPRKGDRMRSVKDGPTFVAANDGERGGGGFHPETDEWRTPISTGGHVYTLKNGAGYRILKRTGEPRHPSAGQAGATARVFKFACGAVNVLLPGQDGSYNRPISGSGWGAGWKLDRLLTGLNGEKPVEITSTPETQQVLADLCAKVPAAAAIINAKG